MTIYYRQKMATYCYMSDLPFARLFAPLSIWYLVNEDQPWHFTASSSILIFMVMHLSFCIEIRCLCAHVYMHVCPCASTLPWHGRSVNKQYLHEMSIRSIGNGNLALKITLQYLESSCPYCYDEIFRLNSMAGTLPHSFLLSELFKTPHLFSLTSRKSF